MGVHKSFAGDSNRNLVLWKHFIEFGEESSGGGVSKLGMISSILIKPCHQPCRSLLSCLCLEYKRANISQVIRRPPGCGCAGSRQSTTRLGMTSEMLSGLYWGLRRTLSLLALLPPPLSPPGLSERGCCPAGRRTGAGGNDW